MQRIRIGDAVWYLAGRDKLVEAFVILTHNDGLLSLFDIRIRRTGQVKVVSEQDLLPVRCKCVRTRQGF